MDDALNDVGARSVVLAQLHGRHHTADDALNTLAWYGEIRYNGSALLYSMNGVAAVTLEWAWCPRAPLTPGVSAWRSRRGGQICYIVSEKA